MSQKYCWDSLRPKTVIHRPQDKQQSSKGVRAWNPEAVTFVKLNSLDPQSSVLESNLMTEATFIWTSVVLSTSHISIFIGILQLKQEFSRQYEDAVVGGPQHTVLSLPGRICNGNSPASLEKYNSNFLKMWTRTRHFSKTRYLKLSCNLQRAKSMYSL